MIIKIYIIYPPLHIYLTIHLLLPSNFISVPVSFPVPLVCPCCPAHPVGLKTAASSHQPDLGGLVHPTGFFSLRPLRPGPYLLNLDAGLTWRAKCPRWPDPVSALDWPQALRVAGRSSPPSPGEPAPFVFCCLSAWPAPTLSGLPRCWAIEQRPDKPVGAVAPSLLWRPHAGTCSPEPGGTSGRDPG